MGEGVRDVPGGIVGLLAELDRYGEAIEYDLIRAGWTLDDVPHRLSWRALIAFVKQDGHQTDSALRRVVLGADHVWGLTEFLLADVFDAMQWGNWQRASAGARSRPPRPKPYPRPGIPGYAGRTERFVGVPLSRARAIFARHNPAVFTRDGSDRSGTPTHRRAGRERTRPPRPQPQERNTPPSPQPDP